MIGPGVVKEAREFGIRTEGALGAVGEAGEEFCGDEAGGGEVDGVRAEGDGGVEEDDSVDEVVGEEGGVEGRAGFDEETEDLAAGEEVEDSGEVEAARWIGGHGQDLDGGAGGLERLASSL